MCDECPHPLDGVFEYRVEYHYPVEGWLAADDKRFAREGAAEAHLNHLTCYAYDENYRVARRLMPGWEAVDG